MHIETLLLYKPVCTLLSQPVMENENIFNIDVFKYKAECSLFEDEKEQWIVYQKILNQFQ